MKKFKFAVSKNQQRYDIVLQANSELEAKERVHKEWYSILSVEEVNDIDIKWNKFIFTVEIGWEIKNWSIYWEDIFKSYLKLKKDFWYNIISLFAENDKDKSEQEKSETVRKLEEEYQLYVKKFQKEKIETKKEISEKRDNSTIEDFHLKKEVEETYKLIDFVLKKVKNITDENLYDIKEEQKSKLLNIYNSLVSIKNSRNVNKLKEIWELALKKVGKLELEYLDRTKNEETKVLLKETNTLLKQIWSKEQFIEKEKDIWYIIKNWFLKLKEFFQSKTKSKSTFLDKETHSFIKTEVLLSKYKEKRNEINKEIYNNLVIFLFPFWENKDKKDILLAKKSVISQNIAFLNAKLKWKVYSYTKIVKWYKKLEEMFLNTINFFAIYFKIIIFLYSLVFVTFFMTNYMWLTNLNINLEWLKVVINFIIIYILISLTRWFFSFSFNFVIFLFLNIFFVINF